MNLIDDYFLLYHGIISKNQTIQTLDIEPKIEYFEAFAIVLSINRKNIEKSIYLNSFLSILSHLQIKAPRNLPDLLVIQKQVIQYIESNDHRHHIQALRNAFLFLEKEKFITGNEYKKLISLFEYHKFITNEDSSNNLSFDNAKNNIMGNINKLEQQIENKDILKDLSDIKTYLKDQKFSIGVTGVMNAGKSTMLNALIGKELLGTSVVPETANLTIIRHSTQEQAKVFYWNKKEWEQIVKSAVTSKQMTSFVQSSRKTFGKDLDNFIIEKSRCDNIDIDNLSLFTSAQNSNNRCNLIKYVQLDLNLPLLQDNIEIVDTPGLDDIVVQREEITKEYIGKSDMLFHLMNVSQSATHKDVEFIIDAILYQNITKVLIIITMADRVDKEQLDEVINYTKESIKTEIMLQNKDSSLGFILDTIEFIPISGKMAALHRSNKADEAISMGYSIERTGILDVEKYIYDNLFGKLNIKGELIIKSSQNRLINILQRQKDILNYELHISSKTKDGLIEELAIQKKKKEKRIKLITSLKQEISEHKDEINIYSKSLDNFLQSEFLDLQLSIKDRVVSDVKYSYKKSKKRPKKSRIKTIINTNIKDATIDIVRDYRHKLTVVLQDTLSYFDQQYKAFGFDSLCLHEDTDMNQLTKNELEGGLLIFNYELLITEILEAIDKSKPKQIHQLDTNIKQIIKNNLSNSELSITHKLNSATIKIVKVFFDILDKPIKSIIQKNENDEISLQNHIKLLQDTDDSRVQLSIDIYEKLKRLDAIEISVKSFRI